MTTTDLVMKSIENMILYGIELDIKEEDYDEYLFEMAKYYNNTDDLVASFDVDIVAVETIIGEPVCSIFIQNGAIRITPTGNAAAFMAITTLLEFIAEKTHIFDDTVKETKEEINEGDDDEFEWI
jgi:hypothetical protein